MRVAGTVIGQIGHGLLLLLGVGQNDSERAAAWLAEKCAELRVFADDDGKMNRSAAELGCGALVVSQFTLLADCHKGRRPNFVRAAPPEEARRLYQFFVAQLRARLPKVETGTFGAMMEVESVNDGPVTIILDDPPELR